MTIKTKAAAKTYALVHLTHLLPEGVTVSQGARALADVAWMYRDSLDLADDLRGEVYRCLVFYGTIPCEHPLDMRGSHNYQFCACCGTHLQVAVGSPVRAVAA